MAVPSSQSAIDVLDSDIDSASTPPQVSSWEPDRSTLTALPVPTLVFQQGRVVFANPGAVSLFRAEAADALFGIEVSDLLISATDDLAELASYGADGPVPVTCRGFGGRTAEAQAAFAPQHWQGTAACLASLWPAGDPPTKRSIARSSDQQIFLALEGTGEGIWDWHVDTGEFHMSPTFKAHLGYGDDELPDTFIAWSRLIDRADVRANERRMIDHLEGRAPLYESELRARARDGGTCWLRLRGKAICDPDKRVRRVVGTAARVDEYKQNDLDRADAVARALDTQSQLAEAMNTAGEGFALFDRDDRLVMFNEKFQNTFPEVANTIVPGLRYEDMLAAAIEAGVFPEAVGNERAHLRAAVERFKQPMGEPFIVQTSDGRTIQVTKRRTGTGSTVVIRTDITRLKETEQALQTRVSELEAAKAMLEKQRAQLTELADRLADAKDEADAANHTKSEFLANMSHELRTPLNAIMGFAEVIKNEMFGPVGVPQYIDYSADIYSSGAHLLEIINDILDLSKIEAGKLEIAEEEIDLREVAEAVFRLVRGRAEEEGIKLAQQFTDDMPRLMADKRKLKQILLNLLTNAIKFTPEGGTVDLTGCCAADGAVSLCVRDTGIGIASDQFDLVLSPFGQVDSALAREHQGTGLGLPLVNALVELHGGTMDISSEVGMGTTITLHFPAARSRPA